MQAEKALEADLVICDPHHHLYPENSPVHSRYLVDDLRADTDGGHHVVSTVYVETSGSVYRTEGPVHLQPVGETEWVISQASDDGLMSGIVGFADLTRGSAAEEILAAHVAAGKGRFRGVRYRGMVMGQPAPPPNWYTDSQFQAGVAVLARMGLILEIFVFAFRDELPGLVELARSFPDLPIVLDHLGTPSLPRAGEGTREEMLAAWRTGLEAVARCSNVTLKVGGIGMSFVTDKTVFASAEPTSEEIAAYWRPELRFAIELFGPDRCMFESNFPPDRELCDYVTLWNVFKRTTSDLSGAERAALFHDNAVSLYHLDG
jgi:L-fuconolactonase